jgi:acyl carrier protein
MTQQEISEICVAALAHVLRVGKEHIDPKAKFSRLGLDSAMIVYVMMELEEKLNIELTTDDFYDYPTVDELSRRLGELRAARNAA